MLEKISFNLSDWPRTQGYRFITRLLVFLLLLPDIPIIYSATALAAALPQSVITNPNPAIKVGTTYLLNQYQLVSVRQYTSNYYDFTLKAQLTSIGKVDAKNVKIKIISTLLNPLKVVDGDLSFGLIKAKATTYSRDTFILRGRFDDLAQINKLKWMVSQNLVATSNAGVDQTIQAGATVYLDGSFSYDSDGDPLTYRWTLKKPVGSRAVLKAPTTVNPTFTTDKTGDYIAQLIVNDRKSNSQPDTVTISTNNIAPVAQAGNPQSVTVGAVVQLDGSTSSDTNGNRLTYRWQMTSRPAGSQADVSSETSVSPTITIDKAGYYSAQLIVNDGQLDSTPTVVVISTINSIPIANAGNDPLTILKTPTLLDGAGSTDVDGEALNYSWSLLTKPIGSLATLLAPTAAKSTVTPDKAGAYVMQLLVSDAVSDSMPDTVVLNTVNAKPVANPGGSQSAVLNQSVILDGSKSSDANGDSLIYRWSLLSSPTSSAAALTNATQSKPSFTVDKDGIYVAQLIVNDGKIDSDPKTTTVSTSTSNGTPIAQAGLPVAVSVDTLVTLDGGASSDPDGDALTYAWFLLSQPAGSAISLTNPISQKPSLTPSVAGDYGIQLVVNDGKVNSAPSTVTVTAQPVIIANRSPQITSSAVVDAVVGQAYGYDVNATDPDADTLNYTLASAPSGMTMNAGSGLISWTPTSAGNVDVVVKVTDGKRGEASQNFTVKVTDAIQHVKVPDVVGLQRTTAESSIVANGLLVGSVTFENNALSAGQVLQQNPVAGNSVAKGTLVALVVSLGPDVGVPPDPITVATAIDPTIATTVDKANEFIYTGSNPIQTGVKPGTIDPKRAAVLRGKVMDKNNQPLSGVVLTVLDHLEFGQTISRKDGQFDMVVNGGGALVINYQKIGYLPKQRQVDVAWQSYAIADDLVMAQPDSKVTTIDLNDTTQPIQVAQGSTVTDSDGTRTATLVLPQGTQASIYNADGSTKSLSTLSMRLTEFTVGANGPESMPGPLPATSGYTYAVNIAPDEATVKLAGKDVLFNNPVPFYVDNFLNMPVGIAVPSAYYDAGKAAWIPSDDGKVIKVLSSTGGLADIDSDGDNLADSTTALAALGITDAERTLLAKYPANKTLWRVMMTHLSTYDLNYGEGAPPDSVRPGTGEPYGPPPVKDPEKKPDDQCETKGSIIGCEGQTLSEEIGVTGTPFSLRYDSDRMQGRKAAYSRDIPLINAVPGTLKGIELEIKIAGRIFTKTFPAQANQVYHFEWDGLDAYGRRLQGKQQAQIRIDYLYDGYYNLPPSMARSFGAASGQPIAGNIRAREDAKLSLTQTETMGIAGNAASGLGAWSLSAHHRYDPAGKVLYLGNGDKRDAENSVISASVITTVAGTGVAGYSGDGGLATAAQFNDLHTVIPVADGSLYISDNSNHRIRRISANGIITTVAGTGVAGFSGDGGVATAAALDSPFGIDLDAKGNLYIAEYGNSRVRKVSTDGVISTVAGSGTRYFDGDGKLATTAAMSPHDIAVAPNGTLYIVDRENNRIRKVDLDGMISTVAGNGTWGYGGDGGAATLAQFKDPSGIALDKLGNLLIADTGNHSIRRVSPDGIITSIAGIPTGGYAGDGGLAISARLYSPHDIAVSADGSLYIADASNARIRRVSTDGIISTIAGSSYGFSGDGGSATSAQIKEPLGIAIGNDNSLYIADHSDNRCRRIASELPGFSVGNISIPSSDGGELYIFNEDGRHLRTVNTITGSTVYSFAYDATGQLSTITDANKNITIIERDSFGNPTAMVSPFAQRTAFTLNGQGYLSTVTNPANERYSISYTTDGLLTRFENPRGFASVMSYDALGKLSTDTNAGNGKQTLVRDELAAGYQVSRTTSEGRKTTHTVENLPTGSERRRTIAPDNTVSETLTETNGIATHTAADGSTSTSVSSPDPRFGMFAPVISSQQFTIGTLSAAISTQRTVELNNPKDPLSLKTLTDTVTVNGRTSNTVYDAATKTFTTTSAGNRQSKYLIDTQGRPLKTEIASILPVQNSYDAQGHLSTLLQGTGADERALNYSYNAQSYLQTVTDPLNRTVNYEYDLAGRVTKQTLPDGRSIIYNYDVNGNLISLAPPGRPDHVFNYTKIDQQQEYVPPIVGAGTNSTVYNYNLDKELTRITRPDGQELNFSYDSGGRLSKLSIPTTLLSSENYTYGYDAVTSNLLRITAPDGGLLDYTYNGTLLTQTQWTGAVSGSVGKSYDNDFRITALSVNNSDSIPFEYDADSLLIKAGDLALNHNAQNGLLTGTTLSTVNDTFSYNGFGEISNYSAKFNSTEHFATDYVYDKLGRITSKTETIAGVTHTFAYDYDTAGRLIQVKKDNAVISSYSYDSNGNRLTAPGLNTSPSYDDQDRLTQYNGTAYSYSANGELKTKTTGGAVTSYDYDVLGNLRGVVFPSTTQIAYITDGENRRIGKKVNGTLTQGFLYQDSLKPIAELDGSNTVVSRFIYATHTNIPDYMIKGGNTYRIITDHLGSPRLVINVADGVVAQRMELDEFGRVTQDTNPGFQPFGFAGGLYDRDTKLVRFGARDYDAETGRWTAKDPILFGGKDANIYGYTSNDPINLIDPSGLKCECPDVPLSPPNVNIDANIKEAKKHWSPYWFLDQVRNKGPWDYKQQGPQYQDFGNFNYGATGKAMWIFTDRILLSEAGRAQQAAGTSKSEWGNPGERYTPFTGTPPYGDDPNDQEQIKKGIEYYKCRQQ